MSDPNQAWQPPPPPAVVEETQKRATHLMPYAIGLFVIGLLVCVGGIIKFVPGGIGTGVGLAFWGMLLFAFSFISLPSPEAGAEPQMSGLQKLAGIFYEPTRVFRNLRSHPRWLAAFLTIAIANAAYAAVFVQRLTPERISEFFNEKIEQSPIKPPPDRMAYAKENNYQQLKQPIQRVQTAAKTFVGIFVFISFVAALCLLCVLSFGGTINFWQAFAAVAYAYVPVAVIGKLASIIILFIKYPDDIHPIIGQ